MSAESEAEAWPDLAGRLTGDRHRLACRVYYEDTDFTGLVYHASFVRFLERGRTDFLRRRGIAHADLAAGVHGARLAFAVHEMQLTFHAPARIDAVLEIETRIVELRGARIVLAQAIWHGDLRLVDARVSVIVISSNDARPRRLPMALRAKLADRTPPLTRR